MRKRKKKRTSGSRLAGLFLLFAAAVLAAPSQSRKQAPYALIAGTVFRDSGFSLGGAEITVEAAPEVKPPSKFKRIKVVADSRGEFAIRVPAKPMRYTVSVKAVGYKPDRKEVTIQGEERADLTFRLEPASN